MSENSEVLAAIMRLEDAVTRLSASVTQVLTERQHVAAAAAPSGYVAPDSELEGEYGNPEIKRDPPRWKGESFVGKRWSETTPEYMKVMLAFQEWRIWKAAQEKTDDKWPRTDAARARGHLLRMQQGLVTPIGNVVHDVDDSEIPF